MAEQNVLSEKEVNENLVSIFASSNANAGSDDSSSIEGSLIDSYLIQYNPSNKLKNIKDKIIFDCVLDYGTIDEDNLALHITKKNYDFFLNNIQSHNLKEEFAKKSLASSRFDTRGYFLALSYLNILDNDFSKRLVSKAEHITDLKGIVFADELINILDKKNIPYNLDSSKSIKENLTELSVAYSLLNISKEMQEHNSVLGKAATKTSSILNKNDLGSSINDLLSLKKAVKGYSEHYNGLESRLSSFKVFQENKTYISQISKNLKGVEFQIKKQLDSEMRDVISFFQDFDLDSTKDKVEHYHSYFNKLIDNHSKLNYLNKDENKLRSKINNRRDYCLSLIDNKAKFDKLSKDLDTSINRLNKESINFKYIKDFVLIRENISGYSEKVDDLSKGYEEITNYGLNIKEKADRCSKIINEKGNLIRKFLDDQINSLNSYIGKFKLENNSSDFNKYYNVFKNVNESYIALGSKTGKPESLKTLEKRFEYLNGFITSKNKLENMDNLIKKLNSVKPTLQVSFGLDYLDQLIKYGSAIKKARSDIMSIDGYKELRKKVGSYSKAIEGLRLEYNQHTFEIKERFKSDVERIRKKVDLLINSRIAVNRESRLDGYEKMVEDYIKIEAELKCLN